MYKRTRTVAILFMSAIIAFTAAAFLMAVLNYGIVVKRMSNIEAEAEAGTYTAYGKVNWTDGLIEAYNNAKAEKMGLVKSSDVASWLYYSGYSMLGKAIRVIVIAIACAAEVLGIGMTFITARYIVVKELMIRRKKESINFRNRKEYVA